MITMKSPVKKLNDLTLHILKSSSILNCVKVFRSGNITVFLGKNGKLYCTGIIDNHYYTPGEYPWQTSLMLCLNKMGVLTDEQINEHIKFCKEATKKRQKGFAKNTIRDLIKCHGKELIEGVMNEEIEE